jgi:putative transcriptional regulator
MISAANRVVLLSLLLIAAAGSSAAWGAEPGTFALVASRNRPDPLYERTVIVANTLQSGEHVGFIVNKPTTVLVADLFPGDRSSNKIPDRVYLGGINKPYALHALVAGHIDPDSTWLELAPYIHVAVEATALDDVMKAAAQHARFFAGSVVWQPGELEEQLKSGAWHVVDFSPEFVFAENTAQLWDELITQAEQGKAGNARF